MERDQCKANKDRKLADLETQRPEIALYTSEKKIRIWVGTRIFNINFHNVVHFHLFFSNISAHSFKKKLLVILQKFHTFHSVN